MPIDRDQRMINVVLDLKKKAGRHNHTQLENGLVNSQSRLETLIFFKYFIVNVD